MAPRLRGIKLKKLIIHISSSMRFLLFYSPKPRSQVRILIYRNWAIISPKCTSISKVRINKRIIHTNKCCFWYIMLDLNHYIYNKQSVNFLCADPGWTTATLREDFYQNKMLTVWLLNSLMILNNITTATGVIQEHPWTVISRSSN